MPITSQGKWRLGKRQRKGESEMGIVIDYFRDVRRSGDPALLQREIELCRQSAGLCDYDKSSLVHCGTEESMLTEALDCLENPFQPILTFAKNFDLVDYGIYGLGLATASTIDEAIKFGCLGRKSGMTPCRLAVALQHAGNGLVMEFSRQDVDPHLDRYLVDFGICTSVATLRRISGIGTRGFKIGLRHRRPKQNLEELREVLGTQITFGCEVGFIELSHEVLDAPMTKANERVFASCLDFFMERGADVDDYPIAQSVRESLVEKIGTLEEVAGRIGMSARTLHRRLVEEGQTFRGIADEVRSNKLRSLVRIGTPKKVICEELGYADIGSLYRAQRRWRKQESNLAG